MLMMKKRILLICVFSALIVSAYSGCASSSSAAASSKAAATSKSQARSTSKNTDIFDDWKYKGFGMQLPQWVQPAIEGKKDKVVKYFPDYTADQIEIVTASGINVDQSENKLEKTSGRVLLDGFWVRLNTQVNKTEEPYITVLIYEK
jgi:hypothetical protein